MGQSQSAYPGQDEGETKVDYYELLGVDRQASEDEIKKAYRRKALDLHPDRNYGNVDEATKLFAEIQSAYEVLSDVQERAWYDSHSDAILRSKDATEGADYVYNVRLTTTEDVLRLVGRFNGRVHFTDAPSGFFGGLREIFQTLAREEDLACQWEGLPAVDYPSFGHADDSYDDVVKPFYAIWNGFSTSKTFNWKDVYRYSDAPDRRYRRAMEKENKRLRDDGIREFNDAVRSLVAFVRKRDPRYKPNSQSEAERQKVLREAAQAQAARSRAANQAKLAGQQELPEWAKTEGLVDVSSSEEETEQEQFECVVCGKTFKSENQFQAHEKSKKHVKAVKQLQRDMQRENETLDLEDDDTRKPFTPSSRPEDHGYTMLDAEPTEVTSKPPASTAEEPASADEMKHDESSAPARRLTAQASASESPTEYENEDDDLDDDYAPRENIAQRMASADSPTSTPHAAWDELATNLASSRLDDDSDLAPKKLGKAKQKRAKKAAQHSVVGASGSDFRCAACQTGFSSKTRLFSHIKEFGHAQLVVNGGGGKKTKLGK